MTMELQTPDQAQLDHTAPAAQDAATPLDQTPSYQSMSPQELVDQFWLYSSNKKNFLSVSSLRISVVNSFVVVNALILMTRSNVNPSKCRSSASKAYSRPSVSTTRSVRRP